MSTSVWTHDLAVADQDVEFEDLVKLAKVLARPWSCLLIDAAEVYPSAGSDNRTYNDELRKLLVRSGAVRFYRPEGEGTKTELWGLRTRKPQSCEPG